MSTEGAPKASARRATGAASMFASATAEIPNALIAALLVTSLGSAPVALGLVEGVAAAAAGAGRTLVADRIRQRTHRHLGASVTLAASAVLSSLLGLATAAWQAALLRAGASGVDDLSDPMHASAEAPPGGSSDDAADPDLRRIAWRGTQLGKIAGPVAALGLFAWLGVRGAMEAAVLPGLVAAAVLLVAHRQAPVGAVPVTVEKSDVGIGALLHGDLRRIAVAVAAFEFGNVAVALLVLRTINLLTTGRGQTTAILAALALYAVYNICAVIATNPAHRLSITGRAPVVLGVGVILFLGAYFGFALTGGNVLVLGISFAASGAGLAAVRSAERHLVARTVEPSRHEAAYAALSKVQMAGNATASAVTGLLWSVVSVRAALLYLSAWLLVALAGAVAVMRTRAMSPEDPLS